MVAWLVRTCDTFRPQARPIDEFMDDFESQEKVFKEEVAAAKERNAERKVMPALLA